MTEENRMTAVKLNVYRQWMFSQQDVRFDVDEIQFDLECRRYERDVTQRLYEATTNEKERQHWQKQLDRLNKALEDVKASLAKKQKQNAYCEAMIAQIRSDLEAEGIDANACYLEDMFGSEPFIDDEFFAEDAPF